MNGVMLRRDVRYGAIAVDVDTTKLNLNYFSFYLPRFFIRILQENTEHKV